VVALQVVSAVGLVTSCCKQVNVRGKNNLIVQLQARAAKVWLTNKYRYDDYPSL